jgi:hypothetical protein
MDACDERQTAAAAFRTATTPGAAEIADLLEETARDLAHTCGVGPFLGKAGSGRQVRPR